MSNLTNQPIPSQYANLLTLNNTENTGLSTVLQAVQDGLGISCPLELSVNSVNINYSVGSFYLNGIALTATANSLNLAAQGVVPSGDTASRPVAPSLATLYFNTETETLEIFNGAIWINT